jgi:hypothetical protein
VWEARFDPGRDTSRTTRDPSGFNPQQDPNITGDQARVIDSAIDEYNAAIESVVRTEREAVEPRDWYLLDIAGFLDRLAARRYIEDPNARPAWWTPYALPPDIANLTPAVDSYFLASDGHGGRARGGLFSLDGVHPTTVAYGIIAQEIINIMRKAGVVFRHPNGAERPDPVTVDFQRLLRRDTLVLKPPQNISPTLKTLGWADEALDLTTHALHFSGS